jgi:hypothetical protein
MSSPSFPEFTLGQPVAFGRVTLVPLFPAPGAAPASALDYELASDAIAAGHLSVTEISEGGSVPNLQVENQGTRPVLFIDGEELQGAKQNRILNTTVLVAAHSKTTIPVSCVEQGRWRYSKRSFESAGLYASASLREKLRKSTTRALRAGLGAHSDQGEVWSEVQNKMALLQTSSPTMAMADAYSSIVPRLEEFTEKLKYVEGAIGLAIAVGSKVISLDAFDRPETARKVWNRLLRSVAFDAIATEGSATADAPQSVDVTAALSSLKSSPWHAVPTVGLGQELRAESPDGLTAAALTFNLALIHGSALSQQPG